MIQFFVGLLCGVPLGVVVVYLWNNRAKLRAAADAMKDKPK